MDTTKYDDYQSILLAPIYNLNIRINGQNHFLLNLIQPEFSLAGHEIQVVCHCKSSLFLTSLKKTEVENKSKVHVDLKIIKTFSLVNQCSAWWREG